MKRSTLLALLVLVCACTQNSPPKPVASVMQGGGDKTVTHECPPGPCVVDVTVDAATCAVSASPPAIMVHRPSDMQFRLRTPGWQFASSTPIHFNPPEPGRVVPPDLFTPNVAQSGHAVIVIRNRYDIADPNKDPNDIGRFPYAITVAKDDGSKTCVAPPVLVAPGGGPFLTTQTFAPVVANN